VDVMDGVAVAILDHKVSLGMEDMTIRAMKQKQPGPPIWAFRKQISIVQFASSVSQIIPFLSNRIVFYLPTRAGFQT
jgi:hypothetical protein